MKKSKVFKKIVNSFKKNNIVEGNGKVLIKSNEYKFDYKKSNTDGYDLEEFSYEKIFK